MDTQELAVLRRQTLHYIKSNPSEVIFTRMTKTPDGAGGSSIEPAPQTPQTVRIIQQQQYKDVERRNAAGEVVRPNMTVLAAHDANMLRGDTFVWEGLVMEVVWVTDMKYELVGEVATK